MAAQAAHSTDTKRLLGEAAEALAAAGQLLLEARQSVAKKVEAAGGIDPVQHAAHGLSWLATTVEALRQMRAWGERLDGAGTLGELERLLIAGAFSEYLAQIAGGIPMSQGEIVRPSQLGISQASVARFLGSAAGRMIDSGFGDAERARLAELIGALAPGELAGEPGLDATFETFRAEMRRFADNRGRAARPSLASRQRSTSRFSVIETMSGLGVFGLTIPESYGGLGLGKESMCVVSEELSRAYIGVGSLGTRSEIAAELILAGGTDAQKAQWLPKLASGEILPTAVFTEPNTGSDLASLKTRAVRDGDVYRVTGQKTWITHPVRADLMTLLVRTNPDEKGYKGLSMLLAPKPRGSDADPFPAQGMTGSEIEVLGYRGMKEFDISFDGFEVPADNLLGGVEGQGFKQLMQTFEAARIQTAARAVGVAQSALDLALKYARDRQQFGRAIFGFPRVANKISAMAIEVAVARQLTYFAARQKDLGRRCDLEAGMAKLSPPASPGPPPTTRCRSTAATVSRSSSRFRASSAMPASSIFSRVRRKSRRR